jgi:predicted PurR-regulated permease PerM
MDKNKPASFAILLISIASIFIIIWGIKATASILNPILLAAVITIVVLPIPQKLSEKGLPDWLSFIITLLGVIAVIALVLVTVFGSSAMIVQDIPTQVEDIPAEFQTPGESPLSSQQMNQIYTTVIVGVGKGVVLIFTVLIIFFFMLSAAITMPASKRLDADVKGGFLEQGAKLTEDVRQYMSIMTLINFLVGVGDALLLWSLGVDYAILWGLIAWFMGYIPSVGFWIAMIPPLILAWSQQGLTTALIVLAGYVIINGSVQNFVQPRMMGKGLGISAVVVFLSLLIWGFLLGGVGAILAVPLTMIVITILNSFPNTRWIATLMSTPREDSDKSKREEAHKNLRKTWKSIKGFFGTRQNNKKKRQADEADDNPSPVNTPS